MSMDASVSGMSPTQARLLVELMTAQSQSAAVNTLLGTTSDGSDGTDATSPGSDFAGMLTQVMGDGAPDLSAMGIPGAGWGMASVGGSTTGNAIAATATQLAADLRGPNHQSYDPGLTPTTAQQVWNTAGWGNGNLQCVGFVAGAYQQAGVSLPATPNGGDFWGAYAGRQGWSEIPNGQGLPQPGDILAFRGGPQGFGHVAIVTGVTPPSNGQPGLVTFAQANAPTATSSLAIQPDGTIQAWPGFQVQGAIRYQG